MQIAFTILGNPKGKERPRMAYSDGRTFVYTPPQTMQYENNIRINYKRSIRHKFPAKTPLAADIMAFYEIPKNIDGVVYKAMLNGDILPTKRPDGDNIIKIILDSLNNLAFHDDAQICKINFEKRYAKIPKVCVKIRDLEAKI
jgi:Holliday junction resolvase RusA-like endonuclease